MTHDEHNRAAASIEARLAAVGLDTEWVFIFGILLGRLAEKLGGYDKADALITEWCIVAKAMTDPYAIKLEHK